MPACFAMQCHLAFVPLVALLAVWLWAWSRWWPRLLPDSAAATAELPRPPWSPLVAVRCAGRCWWWRVLSVGPLLDASVDMHNPAAHPLLVRRATPGRLGPIEAGGPRSGRYVRPDGPWMAGPRRCTTSRRSGLRAPAGASSRLARAGTGACGWAAGAGWSTWWRWPPWRSRWCSASIPAASQFVGPGRRPTWPSGSRSSAGLVWFTAAWTLLAGGRAGRAGRARAGGSPPRPWAWSRCFGHRPLGRGGRRPGRAPLRHRRASPSPSWAPGWRPAARGPDDPGRAPGRAAGTSAAPRLIYSLLDRGVEHA